MDYKKATTNAKKVGFDGVEIHASNCLLDQILQSSTNPRKNEYGNNYEDRFRFLREVVEAIMQIFLSNHIGGRVSPDGSYGDMGSKDNYEMFTYVATELNKYH